MCLFSVWKPFDAPAPPVEVVSLVFPDKCCVQRWHLLHLLSQRGASHLYHIFIISLSYLLVRWPDLIPNTAPPKITQKRSIEAKEVKTSGWICKWIHFFYSSSTTLCAFDWLWNLWSMKALTLSFHTKMLLSAVIHFCFTVESCIRCYSEKGMFPSCSHAVFGHWIRTFSRRVFSHSVFPATLAADTRSNLNLSQQLCLHITSQFTITEDSESP